MLPFALAGTGVWTVVLVITLVVDAPAGTRWTAVAGLLLGLAMVGWMAGYDRRRTRRLSHRRDGA